MSIVELNIANALLNVKEILLEMLANGFGEPKHFFALSNMLIEEFGLNQEQSTLVIENALKLC